MGRKAGFILMPKNRHITWNVAKSAAENASLKLPKLAVLYFRTGRAILNAPPSVEALHGFRLDTKRLRYSLELFRPCYGPGLDKRLASLRQVQDYLGEINDCAAAQELLGQRQKEILVFLERRKAARMRAVRRYWRLTFDAAGQERWWTDYLARYARDWPQSA
jgi:CHAD domain-containing protein